MNTMMAGLAMLVKQPKFWLAVLLTVVAISILVNLGFWQLSRATLKQQMQVQLAQASQRQLQGLSEVDEGTGRAITGLKAEVALTPKPRYLLLDNQVFEGQVGYLAYQLMQEGHSQSVLFELGFVAAPDLRSELPQIAWRSEKYQGLVRLYKRSDNPLSSELMAEEFIEAGLSVLRVQNLNYSALSKRWGVELEAYAIQPLADSWSYAQPWQPIPMSAEKHQGYAVQWFAMAIALFILSIWWLVKAASQRTAHS
ncbi:SURF1 family protein [Vibrio sp. LaRot3]|uniref:SURF1 family protein n=1 Tax=Vibrio sp. LaRot3 TaxID=2998829 RepID=UPI0022CDE7E8|nr:SURF1 family protein [Vibrio sp. LaRot3]